MRTDVAIDKLCNIAPVLDTLAVKISKDKEMKDFILQYKEEKSNQVFLLKIVPLLLKNYKNEMFEILAVWCDKTIDEIKSQSFGSTISQIKKLIEDEDFRVFFQSSYTNKETVVE